VGLLKDGDECLVLVSQLLKNADLVCGKPLRVQLEYVGERAISSAGTLERLETGQHAPPCVGHIAGLKITCRTRKTWRIKRKALKEKDMRPLQTVYRPCSENSLQYTADGVAEFELFKAAVASSAAQVCGRKLLDLVNIAKKVTP